MESGEWRVESPEGNGVRLQRVMGAVIALIGVCSPVCAHENEAQELGHHWEMGAYIGEVRLQLIVMVLATAGITAWMLTARYLRKRRAQR